MTDQSAVQSTTGPWEWQYVDPPGASHITVNTLKGPDILCRFWGDTPPSEHAMLIARAPATAAERDKLVKVNEMLVKALEWFDSHADSISSDLHSAHKGRCEQAAEWMREDDRDFRSDFRKAVKEARAVLDEARK